MGHSLNYSRATRAGTSKCSRAASDCATPMSGFGWMTEPSAAKCVGPRSIPVTTRSGASSRLRLE